MTTSTKREEDLVWREYDIQEQDSDEDASAGFLFFESQHHELLLQEFEFTVSPSTPTLKLTFQESYTQSTGMSIWRGSEVLAEYLKQNPGIVDKKSVLEIGAGVGLVGLTAHHLGASRVLLTDGDEKVLENLRQNVLRNTGSSRNGTATTTTDAGDSVASSESLSCLCPQLIWGKNLDQFRDEYGYSQVILGTDLFYITKSLVPLFQTVHELLTPDDDDNDNDDGGLFVSVMTCSAQSPTSTVFDVATRYGFEWTTTPFSSSSSSPSSSSAVHTDRTNNSEKRFEEGDDHKEDDDDDDTEDHDDQIYIFRRRGCC